MIKKGLLGTTLKDDFLPSFKKDNNREKNLDITIKKVAWLNKVSN